MKTKIPPSDDTSDQPKETPQSEGQSLEENQGEIKPKSVDEVNPIRHSPTADYVTPLLRGRRLDGFLGLNLKGRVGNSSAHFF